jgi:hypothetical protein
MIDNNKFSFSSTFSGGAAGVDRTKNMREARRRPLPRFSVEGVMWTVWHIVVR